ncbi:MAG: hypothetical protein JWP16_2441, partial [Alphaproteobacteria bacterium]|nr:hypothetical protein [Alphaproteobacteria bacterium]
PPAFVTGRFWHSLPGARAKTGAPQFFGNP